MIDLKRYQEAFCALPADIARAEVNAERIRRTMVFIRDGQPASSESFDQSKYYIRAGGDRLGMYYTEKPDENSEEAIRRAADNAMWSDAGAEIPMNGPELSRDISPEIGEETLEDMIALGAAVEARLGDVKIISLSVSVTRRTIRTVNSLGLDSMASAQWADLHLILAKSRQGMQDAEAETGICAAALKDLDPGAAVRKALTLVDFYDGAGLRPVSIPSGKYDCVMSGQVMRNILMTAWRAFAAETMQTGRSCFHQTGEKVGNSTITFINAPKHPASGKDWQIDSEGTPMRETLIVREGIIHEPLYTLVTAQKDGVQSNGCAGRVPCMTGNVPIELSTVPGMFYLKPDERVSREELIERLGTGFVLTYSLDLFHSVNIASGQFSVPCGGFFVKDGKPVGSVSQMTVAGSLKELFSAAEAVGNDLDFDDFYFRNYCVGSPSVLLRGLNFAS